jgi:hypothetical protein
MNQKDTGQIFSSRRYLQRSDQDRVLWTLTDHGGSMSKIGLARRVQMRLSELDVVLQELEQARKVKLSEQRENWL